MIGKPLHIHLAVGIRDLTLYPAHGVFGDHDLGLILEGYGVLIRLRSTSQSSIHVTVSEFQCGSIGLGAEGCRLSESCAYEYSYGYSYANSGRGPLAPTRKNSE